MGESKRIIEKKSENDDDRHSSRKNVHVESKNDDLSKIRKWIFDLKTALSIIFDD